MYLQIQALLKVLSGSCIASYQCNSAMGLICNGTACICPIGPGWYVKLFSALLVAFFLFHLIFLNLGFGIIRK